MAVMRWPCSRGAMPCRNGRWHWRPARRGVPGRISARVPGDVPDTPQESSMRMILVHGINQQGKSDRIVHDEWLAALRANFARQGQDPLDRLSRIDTAFYGDTLERLSSVLLAGRTIAMGAEEASDDFDEFALTALKAMALRMGIAESDLASEAATVAVPQGAGIHKTWIKAIARVIERVSPLRGTLALRVLGQAHAYIRNPHVHEQVNDLVRPLFEDDEPCIVVSHSLGTVVSLALLREFSRNGRPREVPLLLTLGSPLGIDSVRKGFTKPRTRPAHVQRWMNFADPEDFVALHAALTADNFAPGIENHPDVENGYDDPHGVTGYLSDPRVAAAIVGSIPQD
ncbi:hypothetical protein [Lysobacter brunescens]